MPKNYNTLKNNALKKYFERMNDQQQKAVFKINGPLLILAGAGSGKTTVLVNRIANMIHFGNAYANAEGYGNATDDELSFLERYASGEETDSEKLADIIAYETVKPWNILAITFTNKAANELKARIETMLGEKAQGITAATFHSVCVRILRREAHNIGFESHFTIYDTDDSRRVIKSILSDLDINEKMFPPKLLMTEISASKDNMMTPDEYIKNAAGDYRYLVIGKVYKTYQQRLKNANAMDFDDIICHTVDLFEKFPDVLDHYQNLFKYIMVDEYQDTSKVQFRLIKMLSEKFHNICVVGDDDQSIYKFRGATIENILSFEDNFECDKDTDVIKLEQNYRSTQNILSAANELIKHNQGRKGKDLWTDKGNGDKITVFKASSERVEAGFIADTIKKGVESGGKYNDYAILYRTNAQSNVIEQALIRAGISYRIFGGPKFYDRKEIRDILSYLAVINNHSDMLRLRRIINEPKRGIGDATVATLEQIASDLGDDPITVMSNSSEYVPLEKRAGKLKSVAQMFCELTELSETLPLGDLLEKLLDKSGYKKELEDQGEEGLTRLENISELKSTMINYEEQAEEPSLSGFLEEIALYTDIDNLDENGDYTALMTMHSAKGLEFDNVFVAGMEENLFPSSKSMESEADIEEERRLAYVAYTRARKKLYLTIATERMLYGKTERNRTSRFVKEVPVDLKEKLSDIDMAAQKAAEANNFGDIRSMSLQQQLAMRKASKADSGEEFSPGERVKHKIFGEGTVLSATKIANDTLLEIAFDSKGTKKIMANFAKIKKV
ncbi:MAG: UvrD-helicase domain-containing protein [Ruminococcus sp.]|nr:UvrD-helicase domain-containing protein [Ruminococcus sp.]